jgi:hypothetical protein
MLRVHFLDGCAVDIDADNLLPAAPFGVVLILIKPGADGAVTGMGNISGFVPTMQVRYIERIAPGLALAEVPVKIWNGPQAI